MFSDKHKCHDNTINSADELLSKTNIMTDKQNLLSLRYNSTYSLWCVEEKLTQVTYVDFLIN